MFQFTLCANGIGRLGKVSTRRSHSNKSLLQSRSRRSCYFATPIPYSVYENTDPETIPVVSFHMKVPFVSGPHHDERLSVRSLFHRVESGCEKLHNTLHFLLCLTSNETRIQFLFQFLNQSQMSVPSHVSASAASHIFFISVANPLLCRALLHSSTSGTRMAMSQLVAPFCAPIL